MKKADRIYDNNTSWYRGLEEEKEKRMTRGKQKIEAQKKNAEKNQKSKGSQIKARALGLKIICSICKVLHSILPY